MPGVVHFTDAPVTEQFTRAAPAVTRWPWRANMFKTLYRNDGTYRKLGVHRPRSPDKDRLTGARWHDGNGAPLPDMFATKRIFSNMGQPHFGLVQLNHYPLGAMESYVLKRDRGRAVHAEDLLGMDYWVERNFCSDADTTIAAIAPQRDAELAALRSDQTLVKLHETAVQWRKDRFNQLMLDEPSRALFGRLVMTPPSVPVARDAAQFLIGHANRARRLKD